MQSGQVIATTTQMEVITIGVCQHAKGFSTMTLSETIEGTSNANQVTMSNRLVTTRQNPMTEKLLRKEIQEKINNHPYASIKIVIYQSDEAVLEGEEGKIKEAHNQSLTLRNSFQNTELEIAKETQKLSVSVVPWYIEQSSDETVKKRLNEELENHKKAIDWNFFRDALFKQFEDDCNKLLSQSSLSKSIEDSPQKIFINSVTEILEKSKDLKKREYSTEATIAYNLASTLIKNYSTLVEDNANLSNVEKYNKFAEDSIKAINTANNTLKDHRNCKWILANCAFAVLGLGVLYLAACAVHKAATGRFFFYERTKSKQILDKTAKIIKRMEP